MQQTFPFLLIRPSLPPPPPTLSSHPQRSSTFPLSFSLSAFLLVSLSRIPGQNAMLLPSLSLVSISSKFVLFQHTLTFPPLEPGPLPLESYSYRKNRSNAQQWRQRCIWAPSYLNTLTRTVRPPPSLRNHLNRWQHHCFL